MLNAKAAVRPMSLTARRINGVLENTCDAWVLTTYSFVETRFWWKDRGNEKRNVDVRQFSFSKQLVSKSEGHRERRREQFLRLNCGVTVLILTRCVETF
jgi:hypothetical protein